MSAFDDTRLSAGSVRPPSETGNLTSSITFCEASASSARDLVGQVEAFSASLAAAKVSGEPLRLTGTVMELAEQLGAVFDDLGGELRRHTVVAEAYQAVGDDAGDKAFNALGDAARSGDPSRRIAGGIMNDSQGPANEPDAEFDEDQAEDEVFTHCLDCDDPLDTPVKRENDAWHPECDPANPPQYWLGVLAPGGKKIDRDQAESYRRLKNLAEDAFDMVLEWETPYGETFISFPDGSIVDAREWIERPENLDLAGGRDQYAGRGEVNPSAPNRCWIGQTLPSGRLARPLARSYDDVAELATYVCKEVFERDRMDTSPYTVMLPGGELVDANDWAQRPETRRLAGCTTVRNLVQFRATGTCPTCGLSRSSTSTRLIQGEIGEQRRAAAAIYCDTCNEYLPPIFVPITLVDDTSATKGAPPRLIDDADPDSVGTAAN